MSADDVTVALATIPPRADLLQRALASAAAQTHPAAAVTIAVDLRHDGAGATRNRALQAVQTPWVAFLDDDDEFLPEHLEALLACAMETGADYVFSWYEVVGGEDPRPEFFGKPFDPASPHQTTVTTLVRTELAQRIGYRNVGDLHSPDRLYGGEDWRFCLDCNAAGAKIVHLPQITWRWFHHGWGQPGQPGNTSGLPTRW